MDKKTVIIARGDSHIKDPFFATNFVSANFKKAQLDFPEGTTGPTMFGVGNEDWHRERVEIEKAITRHSGKNIKLLLSFGEIDWRCHFQKFGNDEEEIQIHCKKVAIPFLEYIDSIKKKFQIDIYLYSVIPPNSFLVENQRSPLWGYLRPDFNGKNIKDYISDFNTMVSIEASKIGVKTIDIRNYVNLDVANNQCFYSKKEGAEMHLDGDREDIRLAHLNMINHIFLN